MNGYCEQSGEKMSVGAVCALLLSVNNVMSRSGVKLTKETTKMKPVIAIDGYSCSGKGTIAKKLADYFGLAYLDTGKIYRALACIKLVMSGDFQKISNPAEMSELNDFCDKIKITNLKCDFSDSKFLENIGNIVTENSQKFMESIEKIPNAIIRSDMVSIETSALAKNPEIRKIAICAARRFAMDCGNEYRGIIMDGRDTGTAIFPDANCKIFMTAETSIRAQRRFDDLKASNSNVTFEEVLSNLKERDKQDFSHLVHPLKFDKNYVIVDVSYESVEKTLMNLIKLIEDKCSL